MGSLRNMPRETVIKTKRPTRALTRMDPEPAMRTLRACFKHNFLKEVIEGLQCSGPCPPYTPVTMWEEDSLTGLNCFAPVEILDHWLDEFVEDGTICRRGAICWLPDQTPPKDEIITIYSNLPEGKVEAINAVTLAAKSGLSVESVEITMQEILLDYGWVAAKTRHHPPRYYRYF